MYVFATAVTNPCTAWYLMPGFVTAGDTDMTQMLSREISGAADVVTHI